MDLCAENYFPGDNNGNKKTLKLKFLRTTDDASVRYRRS